MDLQFPFLSLFVLAVLVAMLGHFVKVPYAVALVITGLMVGWVDWFPEIKLIPHTLFSAMLPPLLFEAGINIHWSQLVKNARAIGLFAVFGTLITVGVVGGVVHLLLGMPLPVALLLGTIIAPTDPISVVAVFKRLGVQEGLSVIVEAESLFNDGIALVLFAVIQGVVQSGNFSLVQSIRDFFVSVGGGVCIGLLLGGVMSRVTSEFNDHLLEISLTLIVAYGSFLIAEAFHFSGVIAVVTASILVGSYGMKKGMSPTSQTAVYAFWEFAAFAINSILFLIIGLEVVRVPLSEKIWPIFIVSLVLLAGRAVSIYGLSMLLSYLDVLIPAAWRHLIVWSGLRGALSMAMVLGLDSSIPWHDTLLLLTFGVVFVSLLAQGLTIETLVRRLGVAK